MAALDVAVTPALRQTLRRVLADRSACWSPTTSSTPCCSPTASSVLEDGRDRRAGTDRRRCSPGRAAPSPPGSPASTCSSGPGGHDGVRTPTGIDVDGLVTGPAPHRRRAGRRGLPPDRGGGLPPATRAAVPATPVRGDVTELEPHGDRIRVRAGDLSADVTAQAVAELDLAPGTEVTFSVKANEVSVYRLEGSGSGHVAPAPRARTARTACAPVARARRWSPAGRRPGRPGRT